VRGLNPAFCNPLQDNTNRNFWDSLRNANLGVSSRKLRYSYRKLVAHTDWHLHEHVSEAFGKKCMPQALYELYDANVAISS
jgi:hypothetical protein